MPKVSPGHLAARRQQIVDAAASLFAERGFARTTMADVVAESRLSNGAVYHYFPSKGDLVLAVVAGRDGRNDGQLSGESPAELVTRLAGYVSPGNGAEHARLIAQIWGDAAVNPDIAAVASARHQRLQAHLAELLSDSRAAQHATAGNEAATSQVVLAALVGLASIVATGIPVDTASFVRILMPMLEPTDTPPAEHPGQI